MSSLLSMGLSGQLCRSLSVGIQNEASCFVGILRGTWALMSVLPVVSNSSNLTTLNVSHRLVAHLYTLLLSRQSRMVLAGTPEVKRVEKCHPN